MSYHKCYPESVFWGLDHGTGTYRGSGLPEPNDLTPFVVGVCVAWLGTGIRVCSDVILSHKRNGNYVSKGRGMILFRFMK